MARTSTDVAGRGLVWKLLMKASDKTLIKDILSSNPGPLLWAIAEVLTACPTLVPTLSMTKGPTNLGASSTCRGRSWVESQPFDPLDTQELESNDDWLLRGHNLQYRLQEGGPSTGPGSTSAADEGLDRGARDCMNPNAAQKAVSEVYLRTPEVGLELEQSAQRSMTLSLYHRVVVYSQHK